MSILIGQIFMYVLFVLIFNLIGAHIGQYLDINRKLIFAGNFFMLGAACSFLGGIAYFIFEFFWMK